MSSFLNDVKNIINSSQIKIDSQSLELYSKDWSRFSKSLPMAIVFPRSINEVQEIVKLARFHLIPLVPSGGRTGLSGGACASKGEVVLNFELMNKVLEFNPVDMTVQCQAGVITEELIKFASDNGLYYPIDFAAKGSSQLGGNIATNAGGIKVIKYGLTRQWILGLKVVTGRGELLNLNRGLIKNATGYDLRQLFIGSEGTLGIIVEATLKLCRLPKDQELILFGIQDPESIMKIFEYSQKNLFLTAFEMFTDVALKHVLLQSQIKPPFDNSYPCYVLMEFDKSEVDISSFFEHCLNQSWVCDGILSQSKTQSKELWKYRELIGESIAYLNPYKNDISVTISKVPQLIKKMNEILAHEYPDFEVVWFGHIGDGNLHINVLKPKNEIKDEFEKKCKNVTEKLFQIIHELEGSISAEHGVGITKKDFLSYSCSQLEIEYMKNIKTIFDPDHILNPGKIF